MFSIGLLSSSKQTNHRTAKRQTLWWLMESGLEYLITAFTDVIFAYFSVWLFRNEEIRGAICFLLFSKSNSRTVGMWYSFSDFMASFAMEDGSLKSLRGKQQKPICF